jgi:hypothetical protein
MSIPCLPLRSRVLNISYSRVFVIYRQRLPMANFGSRQHGNQHLGDTTYLRRAPSFPCRWSASEQRLYKHWPRGRQQTVRFFWATFLQGRRMTLVVYWGGIPALSTKSMLRPECPATGLQFAARPSWLGGGGFVPLRFSTQPCCKPIACPTSWRDGGGRCCSASACCLCVCVSAAGVSMARMQASACHAGWAFGDPFFASSLFRLEAVQRACLT